MFSIFTYVMSRVTHSEPGIPSMVCVHGIKLGNNHSILFCVNKRLWLTLTWFIHAYSTVYIKDFTHIIHVVTGLVHLSMSIPRGGGGIGHRVGILTFSKKIIKIPTPGQKIIVKISRNKWFTSEIYSLKLTDQINA